MDFLSQLSASTGIGIDGQDKPSIFELIGVEKMRELLFPAFRHMLAIYAQRYPRYILRVYNHQRKVYLILMSLVELSCLNEWRSSLSEHFYGLTRAKGKDQNIRKPNLSLKQILISLFSMTCVPVIESILSEGYERIDSQRSRRSIYQDETGDGHDESDGQNTSSLILMQQGGILERLFFKSYPILKNLYGAILFAFQMAFLHGISDVSDPWLWAAGLKLRRLNMDDYRNHDDRMKRLEIGSQRALQTATGVKFLKIYMNLLSQRVLNFTKSVFPLLIFGYKFLEWWYSSEMFKKSEKLPIPPPPKPIRPNPNGKALPHDASLCPLCLDPRKNDSLIPSGYSFCYTCIFPYVKEHGKCPVTLIPCSVNKIRKLYLS